MDTIRQLCGFAAGLERLLVAKSAAELEATWDEQNLGQLGWEALALARRANTEALEPALTVVDRRLLAALERCRSFLEPHIVTFRVPELERWQHAAAAAVEAARYYPGQAANVIALFQRIRGDEMLRRFLAPKILASLYVLGDPAALPLFEELLIAGHTDPDAGRCEVTRALVAVRKFTGRVAPSSKFSDTEEPDVVSALVEAQRVF